MQVRFITQPYDNNQVGIMLLESLKSIDEIKAVSIVSAFASRATVMRLKEPLHTLHNTGARIRIVLGVDMGGTSKEVLAELGKWPVEVFIFKNKKSGVTFHPKIYLVETETSGEIFIGSNNLTEGGFFKNYEGAAQITYSLPSEDEAFASAKSQLNRFLDPKQPVATRLAGDFLAKLLQRKDIPSEAEAKARAKAAVGGDKDQNNEDIFGFESTLGSKPLPLEYQTVVFAAVGNQLSDIQAGNKKAAREAKANGLPKPLNTTIASTNVAPMASIQAAAFYMQMNATEGTKTKIPGEQRIPLPAIWAAEEFWGWKANYTRDVNPRKKLAPPSPNANNEERVYFNWQANWEVLEAGNPAHHVQKKQVRMYFYENSSDFRFYCREITVWGEPGDIVKIERIDDGNLDFRCTLAKQGSNEHNEWSKFCVGGGGTHSKRGFGFS